jgi:hypothetical protein
MAHSGWRTSSFGTDGEVGRSDDLQKEKTEISSVNKKILPTNLNIDIFAENPFIISGNVDRNWHHRSILRQLPVPG